MPFILTRWHSKKTNTSRHWFWPRPFRRLTCLTYSACELALLGASSSRWESQSYLQINLLVELTPTFGNADVPGQAVPATATFHRKSCFRLSRKSRCLRSTCVLKINISAQDASDQRILVKLKCLEYVENARSCEETAAYMGMQLKFQNGQREQISMGNIWTFFRFCCVKNRGILQAFYVPTPAVQECWLAHSTSQVLYHQLIFVPHSAKMHFWRALVKYVSELERSLCHPCHTRREWGASYWGRWSDHSEE